MDPSFILMMLLMLAMLYFFMIRPENKRKKEAQNLRDSLKVGDVISIPGIGDCEVLANDSIAEGASTADSNNGVVLLPETSVYTAENMNDYNF